MILAPAFDRVKVYAAIIIATVILCSAGYGLVQFAQPVQAKDSDPEPAECSPWATIGAQNVWRCEDDDVVCFINNYAFMQCMEP